MNLQVFYRYVQYLLYANLLKHTHNIDSPEGRRKNRKLKLISHLEQTEKRKNYSRQSKSTRTSHFTYTTQNHTEYLHETYSDLTQSPKFLLCYFTDSLRPQPISILPQMQYIFSQDFFYAERICRAETELAIHSPQGRILESFNSTAIWAKLRAPPNTNDKAAAWRGFTRCGFPSGATSK